MRLQVWMLHGNDDTACTALCYWCNLDLSFSYCSSYTSDNMYEATITDILLLAREQNNLIISMVENTVTMYHWLLDGEQNTICELNICLLSGEQNICLLGG